MSMETKRFIAMIKSGKLSPLEKRDECDVKTAVDFFLLLDRIRGEMTMCGARAEIIEMNTALFEKLKGFGNLVFPAPKIKGKSEWYIENLQVKINDNLENDTICVHGDE